MSDIIYNFSGLKIEKYDVLQVSDDNEQTWLDFCGLRDTQDAITAVAMVEQGGGINGHRKADYRIVAGSKTIYDRVRMWPIVKNGISFESTDRLEVLRLGDEEDIAAGWQHGIEIRGRKDIDTALERCSRLFLPHESGRCYRLVDKDGKVKAIQPTLNAYRISGILWKYDPLRLVDKQTTNSDAYDNYAALIADGGTEWDTRVIPVLDQLGASQDLRETLYCFIAMSL